MTVRNRRIPAPQDGAGMASLQPELSAAIDRFYRAATRLDAIDPVTTELLRLRCARVHDCRICQAVRTRAARQAGLDEATEAQVDHYETSDLDERHKVVLRYVDACILGPPAVTPALAQSLRDHFTPAQIVELSLDVLRFSTQKIHVCLGIDTMPGVDLEGAPTFFDFDEDGAPVHFSTDAGAPSALT